MCVYLYTPPASCGIGGEGEMCVRVGCVSIFIKKYIKKYVYVTNKFLTYFGTKNILFHFVDKSRTISNIIHLIYYIVGSFVHCNGAASKFMSFAQLGKKVGQYVGFLSFLLDFLTFHVHVFSKRHKNILGLV